MKLIYRKGSDFRCFVWFIILLTIFTLIMSMFTQEVKVKKHVSKEIHSEISVYDFDYAYPVVTGYKN